MSNSHVSGQAASGGQVLNESSLHAAMMGLFLFALWDSCAGYIHRLGYNPFTQSQGDTTGAWGVFLYLILGLIITLQRESLWRKTYQGSYRMNAIADGRIEFDVRPALAPPAMRVRGLLGVFALIVVPALPLVLIRSVFGNHNSATFLLTVVLFAASAVICCSVYSLATHLTFRADQRRRRPAIFHITATELSLPSGRFPSQAIHRFIIRNAVSGEDVAIDSTQLIAGPAIAVASLAFAQSIGNVLREDRRSFAEVSYALEMEEGGRRHVIAEGLDELTASGLLHDVSQRAFGQGA